VETIEKIKAVWKLLRLEHGLMLFLAVLSGAIVAAGFTSVLSHPLLVLFSFLSVVFLEGSVFALNDYVDVDIDRENKRIDRPLVSGIVSPTVALILFLLFFPLSLVFAFLINLLCFMIVVITGFLSIAYDFKLKKIKLVGNFYIAYTMAIPFVFGALTMRQNLYGLNPSVFFLSLISFVAGVGREIMKDIMDYRGDSLQGVTSFVTYLGVKRTKLLVVSLYLFAVLLGSVPFISKSFSPYYFNFVYLFFMLLADILFLVTIRDLLIREDVNYSFHRVLTLFSLLLGLFAFLLGAVFR